MLRFLTYFASLVVGLVCAEGLLRVMGNRFATSFYVIDADLGWALRPNAEGDSVEESVVRVKINAAGMRDDREHALDKPAGVYRIAILGDSFAEAMQVPLQQTFSKLMEKDTCRGRAVEVLNFGVQGYGTAQELLTWRLRTSKYSPDAVVLLFYTGNDIYNNHQMLNPTNADAAPYFVIDNGSLRLQPALARGSAMREMWASAVKYSKLAQMATDAFYKFRRRTTGADDQRNRAQFGENYMDRLIYSPPAHAAMREAWDVTEATLPLVRNEVVKTGARFHLAIASSGIQVHPDAGMRKEFLLFVNGSDLYYAEHRVAAAARKAGIDVSILGEQMLLSNTLFHGFTGALGKGHWNEKGHAFVASSLRATLCGN